MQAEQVRNRHHSPSLQKERERELPCAQKSLSKGAGCLEDTPDAECLSLKTSGKPKRFRSRLAEQSSKGKEEGFCEIRGAARCQARLEGTCGDLTKGSERSLRRLRVERPGDKYATEKNEFQCWIED